MAHPIHYAAQMCGTVNGVSGGSRARVQSTVYGVSPKKGLVILRKLIHHGCPIDARDKDGRQPLLWASSAGSSDGILSLVNAGARVDAEDKDGLTALHCAASRGHTDCLETLIALCGAEVDIIDNNGCTALFYAVTLGNADCTELLLNYGSEPNRQDRKGRTPGHCGAAKGQLETLKLLGKHGANLWLRNVRGDLPLHEAVLSRRKDLVLWLLQQRPDAVNASNNDGRCPIHLAALNNNVEMVKILIDHSADVNMLMRSGKGAPITPLDAAIHKGNSAVAKFLQLHGGLPSNSLNDSALQRRLNRSIDSHRSPGSSMQSQLGSHHDPSPEDTHRAFISPEAFDTSIVQYSHAVASKQGTNSTGPFLATSTPIMDDSVQTDPSPSVRDMHVQVSDDFGLDDEHSSSSKRGKGGDKDDSSSTASHRKSERRRRRNTPRESSNSSSPEHDRSSQKTSRASKKSSRRSSKRSESLSQSNSTRQSEDRDVSRRSRSVSQEKLREDEESESPTKDNVSKGVTPHESSEALLDTTLVDEKFSELENVAVQSSETDARDEDLGSGDKDDSEKRTRRKRSKSKTPVKDEEVAVKDEEVAVIEQEVAVVEQEVAVVEQEVVAVEEEVEKVDSPEIDTKDKENENKNEEPEVAEAEEPRPESRKESILKARNNSAKRTSVSWQDEAEQKGSSKEIVLKPEVNDDAGEDADEGEKEKELKEKEKEVKTEVKPPEEETEEKPEPIQELQDKNTTEPVSEKIESTGSNSDDKINDDDLSKESGVTSRAEDYPDEIEQGKLINLQEAARKRSESKPVSRERSVDVSDASSRSGHKHCFEKDKPKTVRKPGAPSTSSNNRNNARSNNKNKVSPAHTSRKIPATSEEREIFLQEQILAGKRVNANSKSLAAPSRGGYGSRRSSREDNTGGEFRDSGFSDQMMMNTSASEEYRHARKVAQGTKTSSSVSMKRRYTSTSKRPGSSTSKRKSIFSSSAKKVKPPRDRNRFNDSVTVNQLMLEQQQTDLLLAMAERDADDSTSTRGDSITSDDLLDPSGGERRRRKVVMNRPRSKLTFSRGEDLSESRLSPRIMRKSTDVDTPISVTQAMQASMRKYNLERSIFQQLLELKRLQIRAGKANEQVLVKRLADTYKKAGLAINFREYNGPYTFKNFEKYLYDQLRLLQANRKIVPRFAPSDDIEKLSLALKKMNATKLPYLEDEERAASCCAENPCSHTTHRCYHAMHAYTGVPCAAYIGKGRKPTFLPKVNPLKAPGPKQVDPMTRNSVLKNFEPTSKNASPMQISISPRNDTQSPITLEVQQGQSTQVFTLPTQTLDPTKNYYVSLSIKPTNNSVNNSNNTSGATPTANKFNFHNHHHHNHNGTTPTSVPRNNPGDLVDDGSISAPPPPAENDPELNVDVERDKHNQSM
ncbi:unnamed protein product [Orchesella dallaii]|uniref:Ankyrin repeat domain-containing protein 12 n=2 Tax=Orchesella dallaii TaxID=48710 RepID=A0ABP1Q8R9_9HEXA